MEYFSDEYLIKNTEVKEIGEELVDVTVYVKDLIIKKSNLFVADRGQVFVRRTVAEMLKRAAGFLPKGYNIIIYDGYRSEKSQKIYFLNYVRKLKKQNPDWSNKKLKKEASKYVANPEGFAPHLTGGAVDVSLAKGGRQISMGGFIEGKDKRVTKRTRENRRLLADIMQRAGFVNYTPEWWHWSYGDRYWAAVKKEVALYDEIKERK